MGRTASDISIYTIAREMGISIATVSRVMNNKTGVSEATRLRVLEVLRKNKFKPNYPQRQKPRIAIIISTTQWIDYYSAQILTGIYEYLHEADFTSATLTCDPAKDESLLKSVREQQCSGIIILAPESFRSQMPELEKCKLPIMLVDGQSPSPQIGFIDNDSYSAGATVTRHLLDLGHRKIGFITRWENNPNHIQRFNGYRDTMLAAGIEPRPGWFRTWHRQYNCSGCESGKILFQEIMAESPGLTALIAINEDVALGAINGAIVSGLKVPGDISIAGFDSSAYSACFIPPLTTISHPTREAGRKAAEAVVAFLQDTHSGGLLREIQPTYLIPGGSTGHVPPSRDAAAGGA